MLTSKKCDNVDPHIIVLACVPLFGLIVFISGFCWLSFVTQQQQKLERQKTEKFLADHGDVVKIIRIHDELKYHTYKRYVYTVRRVWLTCQFEDGYNVEIEQSHGDSIARVPMIDERWRVKGTPQWSRLYLYQRIE